MPISNNAPVYASPANPTHHHRVSHHCLNPFPKPTSGSSSNGAASGNGTKGTKKTGLQFGAMAPRAVSDARTEVLINCNRFRNDEWVSPSITATLNTITGKVKKYPTTAGICFGTLVSQNKLEVAVGIIGTPSSTIQSIPIGAGSIFAPGGSFQAATRIDFEIASPGNHRPLKCLYVPACRNRSLRKNCSLPSGKAVVAPYLVVAVYEPATLLVVRLWVVPVWVSPDQCSMNIVRSDAERGVLDAVFDEGGSGFSPANHVEMERIQVGLGHRLAGDITKYTYVTDLLIFPVGHELPILLEYFGMRSVKKYDETKTRKSRMGWAHHKQGYYRFLPIEAKDMERAVARLLGSRLSPVPKPQGNKDPRQRRLAAEFVRPILAWVKFWRASLQSKRLSA